MKVKWILPSGALRDDENTCVASLEGTIPNSYLQALIQLDFNLLQLLNSLVHSALQQRFSNGWFSRR